MDCRENWSEHYSITSNANVASMQTGENDTIHIGGLEIFCRNGYLKIRSLKKNVIEGKINWAGR
jgi:hypothetical protein